MSRVGRKPVPLPKGVSVQVNGGEISVKGPKGNLSQRIVDYVDVKVEGDEVVVHRTSEIKQARANHGMMRSLIDNMVTGVDKGFVKELQVIGIGYRADVRGKQLVLNLGYSHPINYDIPEGISISVDKSNKITVTGADRQQVGQVAAVIRDYRKPDHYKGKGVRYVDEFILLKAGKSA